MEKPEHKPTAAMLACAAASDAREAFPTYYDEEADRTMPALCGAVELALAND